MKFSGVAKAFFLCLLPVMAGAAFFPALSQNLEGAVFSALAGLDREETPSSTPGFSITAAPRADRPYEVTVRGNLPVVYVGLKTSFSRGKRFTNCEISDFPGGWQWVFTMPPLRDDRVKIAFIAKDPYAGGDPLKRPDIEYASAVFSVNPSAMALKIRSIFDQIRGGSPRPEKPSRPGDGVVDPRSTGGTAQNGDGGYRDSVAGGSEGIGRRVPYPAYPRPREDNGWGIHWFPTCGQGKDEVDRFVAEIRAMHFKWVLFLNDGSNVTTNEYLVDSLVRAGIMPIMRIYKGTELAAMSGPDPAELARTADMVRHYRAKGVPYFQIFNEVNLPCEWGSDKLPPDTVRRFTDFFIPYAKAILDGGGIPGYPAPAFGYIDENGNYANGIDYFEKMVREIVDARGEGGLLKRCFIALHNYACGRDPHAENEEGFWEFKAYRRILMAREIDIPMLGGEGGTRPEDVGGDLGKMADWNAYSYELMGTSRVPDYYFCFVPWLLTAPDGNEWVRHAWIRPDGSALPIVGRLKAMQPGPRNLTAGYRGESPEQNPGNSAVPRPYAALEGPHYPEAGETWFHPLGANDWGGRRGFIEKWGTWGQTPFVNALAAKMRSVCVQRGVKYGFTFDCACGYYEILNALEREGFAFDTGSVDSGQLDAFRAGKPHMDAGREIGIMRVR